MHISLKILVIAVILTEHGLAMIFSPWHYVFYKKRGGGLILYIRENSKS